MARARIDVDRQTERLRDRIRRDVVVRRADATGGEHVIELCPHLIDRADDSIGHIRDDAHLAQRNADLTEAQGEEADVGVLRAARQHLVADHQQTGSWVFVRHRTLRQRKSRSSGISGLSAGGIG